jgi:hypothetical protein
MGAPEKKFTAVPIFLLRKASECLETDMPLHFMHAHLILPSI